MPITAWAAEPLVHLGAPSIRTPQDLTTHKPPQFIVGVYFQYGFEIID